MEIPVSSVSTVYSHDMQSCMPCVCHTVKLIDFRTICIGIPNLTLVGLL